MRRPATKQPTRTFAATAEPRKNRQVPPPLWEAKPGRPGDKKPREHPERERGERLPAGVPAAIKGAMTGVGTGGSLSGEEVRTAVIRDAVQRISPKRHIPERGAVAPPAVIEVPRAWPTPSKPFPDVADDLFREFVARRAFEFGRSLGLSTREAGRLCMGVARSRASDVAAELEQAGGAARWFRQRAMSLIQSGRVPRGREVTPNCTATAFFRALLEPDVLDRWLRDVGYRTTLNSRALADSLGHLEPHQREALEYLIVSRDLWEPPR